jgi:outer membrane biosynthesis protein TonB
MSIEKSIKCPKCGEPFILYVYLEPESNKKYAPIEVTHPTLQYKETPKSEIPVAEEPQKPEPEIIHDEAEPTPEPELAEPPKVLRVHRPKPKPKPKPKITKPKPKPKPKPRAPRRPKYEPPDDNRGRIGKWLDRHTTDR